MTNTRTDQIDGRIVQLGDVVQEQVRCFDAGQSERFEIISKRWDQLAHELTSLLAIADAVQSLDIEDVVRGAMDQRFKAMCITFTVDDFGVAIRNGITDHVTRALRVAIFGEGE